MLRMVKIGTMGKHSSTILASKLSRLRNLKGASYTEVAKLVGKSTNTIRDIESGRTVEPSVSIIRDMAKVYGVSLDWLIDEMQAWPPPATDVQQASDLVRQALGSAGLTGELTQMERQVIAGLRQLPSDRQRQIAAYLQGCLDSYLQSPPAPPSAAGLDTKSSDAKKGISIIQNSKDKSHADHRP